MTIPGNVRRRSAGGDYGEKPLRRYELTEALSPGASASAKFVKWDTDADEYDDTTDTFTLYSFKSAGGNSGDRGICWYAADRQQWEVVESGSTGPKKVTFVLPMALTSQATVSNCAILNDWYGNAEATKIDANNEMGWQADAGAAGYAEWRPSDSTWVITLLPCPQGYS